VNPRSKPRGSVGCSIMLPLFAFRFFFMSKLLEKRIIFKDLYKNSLAVTGPSRVICISTDLARRSDRSTFSSSDPKMHK